MSHDYSLISNISNFKNVSFRPKYGITEERAGFRGTMKLIVRKFSPADVGTYHCVSTNSLGRAEGTLRLYGKWNLQAFKKVFSFFFYSRGECQELLHLVNHLQNVENWGIYGGRKVWITERLLFWINWR